MHVCGGRKKKRGVHWNEAFKSIHSYNKACCLAIFHNWYSKYIIFLVNKYEYNPELLPEDLSIIISDTTTQPIHYISDTKDHHTFLINMEKAV